MVNNEVLVRVEKLLEEPDKDCTAEQTSDDENSKFLGLGVEVLAVTNKKLNHDDALESAYDAADEMMKALERPPSVVLRLRW